MKKIMKFSAIFVAMMAMMAFVVTTNAQTTTNNEVKVSLTGLGNSSCTIDDYLFNGTVSLTAQTLGAIDGTLDCNLYQTNAESVDMSVTDLIGPITIPASSVELTSITNTTENGSLLAADHAASANAPLDSSVNLFDKTINTVGVIGQTDSLSVDLEAGTPAGDYIGTGSIVITNS